MSSEQSGGGDAPGVTAGARPPLPAEAAARWFDAVYETPFLFAGILDDAGVLLDANRLAIEGCGLERGHVLGQPLWEGGWWRSRPDLRELIRERCEFVVARGLPDRLTLEYRSGDGSERTLDLLLTPFVDGAGQAYVAVTGHDVTESLHEARARQEVEQLKDALASRTVIGQAVGTIMAQNQCDSEEAFAVLVKAASDRNVKVRRLAQEIVDTPPAGRG